MHPSQEKTMCYSLYHHEFSTLISVFQRIKNWKLICTQFLDHQSRRKDCQASCLLFPGHSFLLQVPYLFSCLLQNLPSDFSAFAIDKPESQETYSFFYRSDKCLLLRYLQGKFSQFRLHRFEKFFKHFSIRSDDDTIVHIPESFLDQPVDRIKIVKAKTRLVSLPRGRPLLMSSWKESMTMQRKEQTSSSLTSLLSISFRMG